MRSIVSGLACRVASMKLQLPISMSPAIRAAFGPEFFQRRYIVNVKVRGIANISSMRNPSSGLGRYDIGINAT